jgi:recombination protein RecA
MNEQKLKVVESVIAVLEKQFGKGSLMILGREPKMDVESIPSGCLSLDYALGIGGFPKGRIIEVYGPESSGKTSLCLHTIAECQKRGGNAAFIDVEHALDIEYAKALGVNTKTLLFSQPDYGEQALEIVNTLVSTSALDIIVVDSVAALVPKSEIEGEMGQAHMALQARLMSQAMRKLSGIVSKTNTVLIFINQLRSKIGQMFGNPETTTGGNALKFYASVRIDIRRIATLKNGEKESTGSRTRIKVVKSKVSPPFKEVEVDVLFGEGISKYNDVMELATNNNILVRKGAWYEYAEERFNGKEQLLDVLKKDNLFFESLKSDVLKKLNINRSW